MDTFSTGSRTPELTPSRSPSPEPPVQPDHFYGSENVQLPPSPNSDGKNWLNPEDDPLAHRGIPVFKPTMEEFQDFEGYVTKLECWGSRSGIVKVIPPKEWTESLPSLKPQLKNVKIKTPIEQHMLGRGGLFRQENMEKRKLMSVREWAELCQKDEFRAPGVHDVGLHARSANVMAANVKPKTRRGKKVDAVNAEPAGPVLDEFSTIKEEPVDDYHQLSIGVVSPPNSADSPCLQETAAEPEPPKRSGKAATSRKNKNNRKIKSEEIPRVKTKRIAQTREVREANLAERAARDAAFADVFEPHEDWLPAGTKASDYTTEFCQTLERHYWRNCGLGKPAWYGADTLGSLYTDETKAWNVAHLPSTLSRLLPSSNQGLPGVNTPYLYFGMWRATFAWHVEDMDLFSINYIHFGAPKFWYAIPQGRSTALEQTMRGYFPTDTSNCPQFLRHKSFLASPTILAQSSCKPNYLVQHSGEFVITFPRGYHAGFNLGFNCAESVNFALESWLELGKKAKACECISDSVRIDVDKLLADRAREAADITGQMEEEEEEEEEEAPQPTKSKRIKKEHIKDEPQGDLPSKAKPSRKRKADSSNIDGSPKSKKIRIKPSASNSNAPMPKVTVMLKLGPKPTEAGAFPCCLCISMSRDGLLKVNDPPINRKDANDACGNPKVWMAHEFCASIVPETWVDEVDSQDGNREKVVFGVDGIVKDRWNLKCSACTKNIPKSHGAPVQCTKGKCPKAFHVSCAKDGDSHGIHFSVVRDVEKEVLLLEPAPVSAPAAPAAPAQVEMEVGSFGGSPPDTTDVGSLPSNVDDSGSRVLKVIKKLEVQILCSQHNPVVAAAKKAGKQDKMRNDLLALPSMSRIKIRVSAGVFEVSLIRVLEESKSVEVLWDRGVKREFKWGSVVFGSTDGPVQQKPSEPAAEHQRPVSAMPVTTYPSVSAATATHTAPPPNPVNSSVQPNAKNYTSTTTPYMYPAQSNPYDYWAYQQYGAVTPQYPYGYASYYPNPTMVAGSSQTYGGYSYAQPYQRQYRDGQLLWQQPYHGPPRGAGATSYYANANTSLQVATAAQAPTALAGSSPLPQVGPSSATPDPKLKASLLIPPVAPPTTAPTSQPTEAAERGIAVTRLSDADKTTFKDLTSLSALAPMQIEEILRSNPQLQEAVWAAAVEHANRATAVASS